MILRQPFRWCPHLCSLAMSLPIRSCQVRAEAYRDLAMQAINSVADYRSRADQFKQKGQDEIAAEYQQLANEAVARAERYMILADFAEKNAEEAQKAS